MSLAPTIQTSFALGILTMSQGIKHETRKGFNPLPYIQRHASCDWGDLCAQDKNLNDLALMDGDSRIFSAYETPHGKIWIITEYDRSYTTVLFPSEY